MASCKLMGFRVQCSVLRSLYLEPHFCRVIPAGFLGLYKLHNTSRIASQNKGNDYTLIAPVIEVSDEGSQTRTEHWRGRGTTVLEELTSRMRSWIERLDGQILIDDWSTVVKRLRFRSSFGQTTNNIIYHHYLSSDTRLRFF